MSRRSQHSQIEFFFDEVESIDNCYYIYGHIINVGLMTTIITDNVFTVTVKILFKKFIQEAMRLLLRIIHIHFRLSQRLKPMSIF